jgi:hypothetical protein
VIVLIENFHQVSLTKGGASWFIPMMEIFDLGKSKPVYARGPLL